MQKKKRWHKPKRKKPPGGLDKAMLTETFTKPLILSTYTGFQVAQKNLKVQQYDIIVETPQGGSVTLPKDSCLFALPMEKWDAAKSHIKRRDAVKKLNLGPEKFLASRRLVQSDLPRDKRPLKMRMRNGLVLYGHIVSQDRYNILMRVGGKVVLVFKHGVHEILGNEKKEGTPT